MLNGTKSMILNQSRETLIPMPLSKIMNAAVVEENGERAGEDDNVGTIVDAKDKELISAKPYNVANVEDKFKTLSAQNFLHK